MTLKFVRGRWRWWNPDNLKKRGGAFGGCTRRMRKRKEKLNAKYGRHA